MRKFLSILLLVFMTVGIVMQDAEARRFGGGRSFGISRSSSSFTRSSSSAWQNKKPFGQQQASPNRWLGPLAGLITGGMLASLFMHNGVGGGIVSILLALAMLYFLFQFLRRYIQHKPAYQRNHHQQYFQQENVLPNSNGAWRNNFSAMNASVPDFDEPGFLREAKAQFIRLQHAYDQKDLNDIHSFTTPEVFAEIKLQFEERGIAENKTDVMSLEAELLNVETTSQSYSGTEMQTLIASVRFNGMLQEARHLPAAAISEIWHFKKEAGHLRWLVAGVQQV